MRNKISTILMAIAFLVSVLGAYHMGYREARLDGIDKLNFKIDEQKKELDKDGLRLGFFVATEDWEILFCTDCFKKFWEYFANEYKKSLDKNN